MIDIVRGNLSDIRNRYINLPVDDWAWSLMITMDQYSDEKEIYIGEIEFETCKTLVLTAIEDALLRNCPFMNYNKEDNSTISFIISQPWFDDENDSLYDYLGRVVAYLEKTVIDTISQIIPKNNTAIYVLKKIRNSIYYLENKGDYRIFEYYRMKDLYEPDNVQGEWYEFLETPSDKHEKKTEQNEVERLLQAIELAKYDEYIELKYGISMRNFYEKGIKADHTSSVFGFKRAREKGQED